MATDLKTMYKEHVIPALQEQFSYSNAMQVPKVEKIILNVGYGRHAKDKQYIDAVENTLRRITGHKPIRTKAKKSISNFKIRQGMEIGAAVTLRGPDMYDFLYKLIHLTLPRVRDFRGLNPKAFDGRGNYTIGLKENLAFPEMSGDTAISMHGLQIVITTTARTDAEGRALLENLGLPFSKK